MTGTTKGDSKNQVQGSTKEVNFIVTFIAIFTAVVSKDGRVHAHKRNQSDEIVDDTHLSYFGEKVNSSWPRVTGTSLTDPGQKADFCMSVAGNGRYYGNVFEVGTNIPALRPHNIVKVWVKPGARPTTPPIVVFTVEERRSTAIPPAAGLNLPSGEGIASGSKSTPSGEDSASGSEVAVKKKRKSEDTSLEEENFPQNRGEGKRRCLQSQKGKEAAESQQLMRYWINKGKEAASPSPRRRPVARHPVPRPQQQQQAPQPDLDRRNSLDTLVLVASLEYMETSEEEPSDEETEAATILAEMSE